MIRRTRYRQLPGADPQADVDEELAFHLAMRTAEMLARGETPARAAELAHQRFGELERTRQTCVGITRRRERKMLLGTWTRELVQDVSYAFRTLRRAPGFTVVAVATLALGIGATSAVFSVVHAALVEGLPYPEAGRLHRIRTVYPDGTPYSVSAPDFMSLKSLSQRFERIEAYARGVFTLSGAGPPREVRGLRVSKGLFTMLGIGTVAGRPFADSEHRPGSGGVVVIDHGYWVRELGADAAVLGRTYLIAGQPYVVVGVLAPGARLPDPADLYAPLEYGETFSAQATRGRRGEFLRVIGKAAPGASPTALDADLRRVGSQLQKDFPDTNARLTFGATPEVELLVGEARTPLLVLFGAVALVLLVACANVANLLLARGSARRSELAVRAAIGAGRGRLTRQLVAEALVLGLAGGVFGVGFAYSAVGLLLWAEPVDIPRLDAVAVNGPVLLFTFVCAVLTALVFGVVPALQSTGGRLLEFVHAGGRGGDGGGHGLRSALVVAETALAVVLLVSAGLLIRSFVQLARVDPGFIADRALTLRVLLQGPSYEERDQLVMRASAIVDRLRALPGVSAVAATSELPLSGRGAMLGFAVVGAPPPPPNVNAEIAVVGVTPDYLRAIGASLLRGRPLEAGDDDAKSPPVALLNEAAVRLWFPQSEPLGARVAVNETTFEVVGVVRDVRQEGLREPAQPQLFAPFALRPARNVRFVLRGNVDAARLAAPIRRAVGELDASAPIAEYGPLERLVDESVARPRFYTTVVAAFAAAALLLAAVGLFGVLSYSVLQRSREIGVRLALGATGAQVTRMVVGSALRLIGLGLVIGVAGALGTGRLLRSQLFGVGAADPLTIAAVAAALVAAALAASYLPARRASSLEPGAVLREG